MFPEFNWVWSPQGVVAMHQPETWGFVQFTETKAGEQKTEFQADPEEEIKWLLRQVYYAERKHMEQHGKYTPELSAMDQLPAIPLPWHLTIFADEHFFLARARSEKHSWYIREDGKVWRKKNL